VKLQNYFSTNKYIDWKRLEREDDLELRYYQFEGLGREIMKGKGPIIRKILQSDMLAVQRR
jgi:hypothetical protein